MILKLCTRMLDSTESLTKKHYSWLGYVDIGINYLVVNVK